MELEGGKKLILKQHRLNGYGLVFFRYLEPEHPFVALVKTILLMVKTDSKCCINKKKKK